MEDYFLDELLLVLDASAEIARGTGGAEAAEAVRPRTFRRERRIWNWANWSLR